MKIKLLTFTERLRSTVKTEWAPHTTNDTPKLQPYWFVVSKLKRQTVFQKLHYSVLPVYGVRHFRRIIAVENYKSKIQSVD